MRSFTLLILLLCALLSFSIVRAADSELYVEEEIDPVPSQAPAASQVPVAQAAATQAPVAVPVTQAPPAQVPATATQAPATTPAPVAISTPLTGNAAQQIADKIGVNLNVPAPVVENDINVMKLNILPGSELIGVSLNLRYGYDASAMVRPLIKSKMWKAFPFDAESICRIPTYQTAIRNFRADITTKIFNSAAERAQELALSAGISVAAGPVDLSLDMKMKQESSSDTRTVISEAALEVGMYDINLVELTVDDLQPELLAEFNKLPLHWVDGPMVYDNFVKRWGTHYIKSAAIGGMFQMIGTTTTDKSMTNQEIAVGMKFKLDAGVKVGVNMDLSMKQKQQMSKMQSTYDFHARGGDPAVGGMLAEVHSSGQSESSSAVVNATNLWLLSLKKLPSTRSQKLASLHELFGIVPGTSTLLRQDALKQAISVFLKEVENPGGVLTLVPGHPQYSNFWRVGEQCLTFQAAIGPSSTLVAHLTASASKPGKLGYALEINQDQAIIKRAGKVVATTTSTAAISPGSSVLYSSYILCVDPTIGNIMYGRGRRVVMPFADPKPMPALFYGFSVKGPEPIVVTGLSLFDVKDLECPTSSRDGFCGGSARGECQANRMCQCKDGFKGPACQFDCPVNAAMNNTICSGRGVCGMDDNQSDNMKPFCQCQSGFLGESCEIAELPSIVIKAEPKLDGMLMSSRPTRFAVELKSNDARAAQISPASVSLTIAEADGAPMTFGSMTATRNLGGGQVTVTATITFPRNPDVVTATAVFDVKDCLCSARGRCDSTGRCVCRSGASGLQCEMDDISGFVQLRPSDLNVQTAVLRYARPFARTPLALNVEPYEADGTYSVNIDSTSADTAMLTVTRTDPGANGWTSPLRLLYKSTGLRLVGRASGSLDFGMGSSGLTKTLNIRFPQPYPESPFVDVRIKQKRHVKGAPIREPEGEFAFEVKQLTPRGAQVVASLVSGIWTERLEVNWEALPVSAQDVRQKGVVKVGARAKGPSTVTIKFPKVYRKVPTLTVSEVKEKKKVVNSNIELPVEAFDFSVVSIDQAKAVVRISAVTEDSAENAGWKKNLQMKWTAVPADFDAKIAEEVTIREQSEVLGSNLGAPLLLSASATEEDCAQLCKRDAKCSSFVFHTRANGCGSSISTPQLLGVALNNGRLVSKASVEGGKWTDVVNAVGSPVGFRRVMTLRDGKLLAVGKDHALYTRSSVAQAWQIVPNSCCVNSVTELSDGRLLAVQSSNKGFAIKATSDITSQWVQPKQAPKIAIAAAQPSPSAPKVALPPKSPVQPKSTAKPTAKPTTKPKSNSKPKFIELEENMESDNGVFLPPSAFPSSFALKVSLTSFLGRRDTTLVFGPDAIQLTVATLQSSTNAETMTDEYMICAKDDKTGTADLTRCLHHSGGALHFADASSAGDFNFGFRAQVVAEDASVSSGMPVRIRLFTPFPGDGTGRYVRLGKNNLPTVLSPAAFSTAVVFTIIAEKGPAAGTPAQLTSVLDIVSLSDGSLVAVGADNRLYTRSKVALVANENAEDSLANMAAKGAWRVVGDHSCCVSTISADANDNVIGVSAQGDVMRMSAGLLDPWQMVSSNIPVLSVSAYVRKSAQNSFMHMPGFCVLKSTSISNAISVPNKCASSGEFLKGESKAIQFSARVVGTGDKCGNTVSAAASVMINETPRAVMRGINVYVVSASGNVQWAQSDLVAHDSMNERGGGDSAVLDLLQSVSADKSASGVIVACFQDCSNKWTSQLQDAMQTLGSVSFSTLPVAGAQARDGTVSGSRSSALFVKNLNSGNVVADVVSQPDNCAAIDISGQL